MKNRDIVYTTDKQIVLTWLLGGQTNGSYDEGFFCFDVRKEESSDLISDGKVNTHAVLDAVKTIIKEFGDYDEQFGGNTGFNYYGKCFRFRLSEFSERNLHSIACAIRYRMQNDLDNRS